MITSSIHYKNISPYVVRNSNNKKKVKKENYSPTGNVICHPIPKESSNIKNQESHEVFSQGMIIVNFFS
jgi:hypothetical protein